MPQEVYELKTGIERIRAEIRRMAGRTLRPVIVGVGGGSGSGKTKKVAEKIKEMFLDSEILNMDDYVRGAKYMKSINSKNWDEPRVYELELLVQHLKYLKKRIPIQKPIYRFTDGRRTGYESFLPKDIIILEGIFALHEDIVEEVDLKVFVEVSVHGSLIRRILRDIQRTGKSEEEILTQYVETVYPMYKLHIEPTRASADIVIVNQYVPEIEAENCESREIQLKVSLPEGFPREKFLESGFERTKVVRQEDVYFLAPNWEENYHQELMRVRKEGDKYFLAYKGPQTGDALSVKPKIEFEVKSSLKDALLRLGYAQTLSLRKKREIYVGRGLEIVFDQFEDGFCFLEVRSADTEGEEKIFQCLEELDISREAVTKKSYLEIMFNKCIL